MPAKKILVIDDEELLIKTMSKLLEKQGYEVYTVRNGSDAIVMMDEDNFDLIISDIRMPGIDGVDTIRQIQKNMDAKKLKVPVIFVTGFADEDLEKEARKLNPVEYLYKPFDVKQVIGLIKETLGT